jgi:hypothetical protein
MAGRWAAGILFDGLPQEAFDTARAGLDRLVASAYGTRSDPNQPQRSG